MKWRVRFHEDRGVRGEPPYEPQTSRFGIFWRTVEVRERNRDGGITSYKQWCKTSLEAGDVAQDAARLRWRHLQVKRIVVMDKGEW